MNIKEFKNINSAKLKTVSPTPLLELDILISFVLEKDDSFIYANPECEFGKEELNKLNELIKRRLNFEPIAYIVGFKEFYGNKFIVDPRVLIPRPETEKVVDLAYEKILEICNGCECMNRASKCCNKDCCHDKNLNCDDCSVCNRQEGVKNFEKCEINIADIGSGCGCIIISLAKLYIDNIDKFGNCKINFYASDISKGALEVAKLNASKILGTKYKSIINFKYGSLLEPLKDTNLDIITANLPYIPKAELASLAPDIKNHEPMLALDGGDDGFELINQLKRQINKHNKSENKPFVILEIQNGEIIIDK